MRATFSADQTKAPAVAAKTTPGEVTARRRPPSAGPDEAADALDRARRDVRSRQLPRVARQRRYQGGLGGLERGRDDGDERGKGIDNRHRAARECHRRGSGKSGRADRIGREHDPLPRIAVCQERGEGRHDGRWEEAQQRDEADGGRSSGLVGEHTQSDRVRPVAGDRADPCELEPPQSRIPEDVSKGPQRFPKLVDQALHALAETALFRSGRKSGKIVACPHVWSEGVLIVDERRNRGRRARKDEGRSG